MVWITEEAFKKVLEQWNGPKKMDTFPAVITAERVSIYIDLNDALQTQDDFGNDG